MNYIIFDLENNCSFSINKTTRKLEKGYSNTICPNEIIQIGAVKLNKDLETIDTFRIYIKPKLYRFLHPKVKNKTKITMNDLKYSLTFKHALKQFISWISDDYTLCCWGKDDILTFKRNCKYHKIDCEWIEKYIDVQALVTKYVNSPHQIGLKTALEEFNIPIESQLHDALNDAKYTAKVFKAYLSSTLKDSTND